jgi:flagellar basal-body rod modification protein FlgD
MSISPLTNTAEPTAGTTAQARSNNTLGKQEFMQLLVTQLRNQDPLSPLDDKEFMAQMAQLSTLETTQSMSQHLSQVLAGQQQTQALQLVGREVDYTDGNAVQQGKVTAALLNGSDPTLLIDGHQVPLTSIQAVR